MIDASIKRLQRRASGGKLLAALLLIEALLGSTLLAQTLPGSGNSLLTTPRYLPVDQAFRYYTSLPSTGKLAVHWEIEPGYYLYKSKFDFKVLASGAEQAFTLQLPDGKPHSDEFFGDVEVYFENMAAEISFPETMPSGEITLLIEYQGCAEAGFCYTLQRREIPLVL